MLDDLLDSLLTGVGGGRPGRSARRAAKLLAEGRQATARIVGIAFLPHVDSHDETRWALDVSAGFRAGCRLSLRPQPERAHLGAEVVVRHDGETTIIDWRASLARWGVAIDHDGVSSFKALSEPPAEGIEDHGLRGKRRKRIDRGEPVSVEVVSAARGSSAFGALQAWDLRVRADGTLVDLRRENVPFYAAHLLAAEVLLPAAVDGGDLLVDWERAAEQAAAEGIAGDIGTLLEATAIEPAPAEPVGTVDQGPVEGVDFDRWVEIEAGLVRDRVAPADHDAYAERHGVAAGRWGIVSDTWHARAMSDWRIGARYGEAFAAARKRKR